MRILTLSAALIAATLPTAAMAEGWVKVAESIISKMYIHQGSILTLKNGHKLAWVWKIYTDEAARSMGGESSSLEQFDCVNRRTRQVQFTQFNGLEVSIQSDVKTWDYAGPGTNNTLETRLNFVCFGKLD